MLLLESFFRDEIFIYGKGKVGKLVFRWIKQKNFGYFRGFVVSKLDEELECMGYPVIEVGKINVKYPNVKILVCVSEQYRKEIEQELQKQGIDKYVILSDEILKEMEQEILPNLIELEELNKKLDIIKYQLQESSKNKIRLQPRTNLKFEVHITEHCNLNCRGCFHCSPLAKEEFLSVEEYKKDCRRLAELYHGDMESIELLGGEPLLHPDIIKFFEITRECFPIGKIILVTNGMLLLKMKEEFWRAAQQYKITIWPTKYPINVDYDLIEKKAKEYGIPYGYFTMTTDKQGNKLLENYHFDIEGNQSAENNFYNCYRGNYCITLSHGRLYSCAVCAHMHHFKEYFQLDQMVISDRNSIDIYDAENAEQISEFLTHPMPACRYCKLTDVKTLVPFKQSEKKMEEWI